MKILSWNINGIRAIHKKKMTEWLFNDSGADIICLQEIKAKEDQIPQEIVAPNDYESVFNPAQKPGYSGTAVYTRKTPSEISTEFGMDEIDSEGRFIKLDFPEFSLINLYVLNGGRDTDQLKSKLDFYRLLKKYVEKKAEEPLVIVGDFNIARTKKDLAQPDENENSVMFKPEEREALDELIKAGLIDTFREFNNEAGHYTWWAYWANSRARNLGWRIDYCFITEVLKPNLESAYILPEIMGSDHCPVVCELDY